MQGSINNARGLAFEGLKEKEEKKENNSTGRLTYRLEDLEETVKSYLPNGMRILHDLIVCMTIVACMLCSIQR